MCVISEVSSNCVMSFDCSMSSHWAESPSLAATNELLAQGHFWGTLGEKSADAIWWFCWWGWNPKRWVIRCGHLGFWLNLWLRNTSGEISTDLLGAASGTAVAVTLVAEPGGSCYQARKAWLLALEWWEILQLVGVSYRASTRAPMTCGSSCRRPVSYMEFFQKKETKANLAPRLAMLCKGTAWSQVRNLDPVKLVKPRNWGGLSLRCSGIVGRNVWAQDFRVVREGAVIG